MVRLHLGCGSKIFRGYVNIDNRGDPDVLGDITDLSRYADGSVDEILAVHVFEHFFPWKVPGILSHWCAKLKKGGKLILEMPDLQKVLGHFKDPKSSPQLTMLALYGGEESERIEDLHKWCWDYAQVEPLLKAAGFSGSVQMAPEYHLLTRDFRVEAIK